MVEPHERKSARVENGLTAAVASERIIDALRKAILSGQLEPGSRVRQEEIASQFGISRIPVREALRQLESEGLIVLVPNSGAWIFKLDRAECVEIYKIRERLEPLALLESCPALSDSTLDNIEDLARRIEQSGSPEEFLRLDREFHLLSYEAAGMPQLMQMIQKFWNVTQQYRRAFTQSVGSTGMETIFCEHRLICEALRRRDSYHASMLLHGHIRRTRLQLERSDGIFVGDGKT
ncbi:GntR family transcriptional regulator [Ancylobacter sp.]|uniref:GntR family transcriptional regulator n=1 Tax=Ancylobacter sp. TaxID=1872567 RepID=UPI003C7AE142